MNASHVYPIDTHRHADASDSCRRCGACCMDSGPALHAPDKKLIASGRIPAKYLLTIRRAEPVWNNVIGRIEPAPAELIKLAGRDSARACVFYHDHGCRIYVDRPLECRLQNCRRPQVMRRYYQHNRLNRSHLIQSIAGLWDMVVYHDNQCAHDAISGLARKIVHGDADSDAVAAMTRAIGFDRELRRLIVERYPRYKQMLNFILGRPLYLSLSAHGIDASEREGKIVLRPTAGPSDGSQLRGRQHPGTS